MLSHCSVFQCSIEGLLWTVREGHKFISFCYMSLLIKKKSLLLLLLFLLLLLLSLRYRHLVMFLASHSWVEKLNTG